MAKKPDVPAKMIEAALGLAASRGWRDLSLVEIAREAGLSLSEVWPHFHAKGEVLGAFSRQLDAEVLAEVAPEDLEESPRDRLFDLLMRRFDALRPHKAAAAAIFYDSLREPLSGLALARSLRQSMAAMLEAAGISSEGLKGALRVRVLTGLYLSAFRVWLKDESEDMAKTMAALDGTLRRVEGLAERFDRHRPRPGNGREESPAGGKVG